MAQSWERDGSVLTTRVYAAIVTARVWSSSDGLVMVTATESMDDGGQARATGICMEPGDEVGGALHEALRCLGYDNLDMPPSDELDAALAAARVGA